MGAALDEDRKKEDGKRKWCEEWLLKRDLKVSFNNVHQELRLESKLLKKNL